MNFYDYNITFNEIPNEISLTFSITGCEGKCKNCHSNFLHSKESGQPLTLEIYKEKLIENQGMASVVLFLGGDWEEDTLNKYLKIAKKLNYKTALYTSKKYKDVSRKLKYNLTYLKTGKYMEELGGLESIFTNQKLFKLKPKRRDITSLFWPQSKPKIYS